MAPEGTRRMGSNPHANGGALSQPLELPDFRDYAIAVACAWCHVSRGDAGLR